MDTISSFNVWKLNRIFGWTKARLEFMSITTTELPPMLTELTPDLCLKLTRFVV